MASSNKRTPSGLRTFSESWAKDTMTGRALDRVMGGRLGQQANKNVTQRAATARGVNPMNAPASVSGQRSSAGRSRNATGGGFMGPPRSGNATGGGFMGPSRNVTSGRSPSTPTGPSRGPTAAPSRTAPSRSNLGTSRFAKGGGVKRRKK